MEVSGHFTPNIYWLRGWVRPRVGLDAVEERNLALPIIELGPTSP
jgi:hypothetical protein